MSNIFLKELKNILRVMLNFQARYFFFERLTTWNVWPQVLDFHTRRKLRTPNPIISSRRASETTENSTTNSRTFPPTTASCYQRVSSHRQMSTRFIWSVSRVLAIIAPEPNFNMR